MPKLFGRLTSKAGTEDVKRATLVTTPWQWRDTEGCYVGHNAEVWLYRQLPLAPLSWEDAHTRLMVGRPVHDLLAEIGASSNDFGTGLATLSQNREIHLVSISWEAAVEIPDGSSEREAAFLREALYFPAPRRALLIGVRLRSDHFGQLTKDIKAKGVLGFLKGSATDATDGIGALATKAMGENAPKLEAYARDRKKMTEVFNRHGAAIPERAVFDQLESWFNLGKGPDISIIETKDELIVGDSFDRLEMAAVMRFDKAVLTAPDDQWGLAAITSTEAPAHVVSIRGQLEPSKVTRARAQRSQRRMLSQIEQQDATGDLERPEDSESFHLAKEFETYVMHAQEPLLTATSIVLARRSGIDADSTYIDELAHTAGIAIKALEHRQLAALDECLPCSDKRVNPFLQDVSIAMIAYAGLSGFSNLGDRRGVFVGLADPDYSPVWLDPLGAPAANQPPILAIFGQPGSGKTMLAQLIITQAVLNGQAAIFINPKGMSSLAPFATKVGGAVVKMNEVEASNGGFFDPFSFCDDPAQAAELATSHILSVLGSSGGRVGFTQTQELALGSGMKRAAAAGVACVGDALKYVDDPAVVAAVMAQCEASNTFSLGVATTPMARMGAARGLVLIEWGRQLALPEKGTRESDYSREERINLAAIRLVTRASMEMLARAGGGIFALDEAWTLLGTTEGLGMLQTMGRLGRSQNILPILATQRVKDLLADGVDFLDYISRVFCMRLDDPEEAKAALTLCGLEPTPQRISWLAAAGPRKGDDGRPGRPACAIHRDLNKQHAAVMVGPIPQDYFEAWTTNPEDVARREAAAASAQTPAADGAGN